MEKKFKRTTVTSALPYANGPVHIGHLAGVYVPADIYVRYLRLKKEDVLFIGGSDEHGVPITIRAKKEGITPQDVVDRYHSLIKESFKEFGKEKRHSKNSVSHSTCIAAPLRRRITNWLRISSKHYTIKENSSKKHPNNITTRKQKHSLPTVISLENVPTAIPKVLTATNAKNAEPHFLLRILSTRKVLSAAANR